MKANQFVAPSILEVHPDHVNNGAEYLSDVSPSHKPWDVHRLEADEVENIYSTSTTRRHQRYGERVALCSQVLHFARSPPTDGPSKLKLKAAWFCRVRHCPVCQWRRAMQLQARFYQALPRLLTDYPDARFIFLTLTIRNCHIAALRSTLKVLADGWKRLIELRVWPALGWVRAVEITRSQKDRSAHPHYHALLMVPSAYFQANYLKQDEWAALWQQCLRINYRPIVDVRVIKQNRKRSSLKVNNVSISQMWMIVAEILKYSVKPSDMIRDPEWFLALSDQVIKTRAVATGGILKGYLRKRGHDDLTSEPAEEAPQPDAESLFFGWKQQVKRYRRM